ncbi:DNA-processing protein DprA [Clostridium sp. CS001]|uniref:DNA-processing protein DprA n=1 Tax=Clostridium sp. CS001 TaxID=2880648 RepID=UPI001CF21040|nr:DNA-processing protein DprA [Clostridium sp. CS001]MCB2289512.1 DNA-processing protein DprA [Clostridium sp. CS001]
MEVYWLWLSLIKGIGPITAKKLLLHYKDAYCIYNATKDELENISILSKKQLEELITSKSLKSAQNIINECKKREIKVLTYDDELYKEKAKLCFKSPIVLFYRGNIIKDNLSVGIVGARRCSDYGKKVAVEVAEYLAQNNVTVISGMAKGIDSYAHTACIKSGALTTAKFAKENKTEVYAVPNNIYAKESKGTNMLIETGAKIYLTPNQLVDNKNNVHINTDQYIDYYKRSPLQNQILSLLKNKPKNLEEILFIIKEKKEIIIETLSIMEVEGMIEWSPRGVRILY